VEVTGTLSSLGNLGRSAITGVTEKMERGRFEDKESSDGDLLG